VTGLEHCAHSRLLGSINRDDRNPLRPALLLVDDASAEDPGCDWWWKVVMVSEEASPDTHPECAMQYVHRRLVLGREDDGGVIAYRTLRRAQ